MLSCLIILNSRQGFLDEFLDFFELVFIALLSTLDLSKKFDFGVMGLLLDEVKLLLVEGEMVLNGCFEVALDFLKLFRNTLDSWSLSVGHEKDMAELPLEIITIDLNVLLVHDLSETIDILNLLLDNQLISIADNSDKEVQEYNEEQDDIQEVENQPDYWHHNVGEYGIVVDTIHPVFILRRGNITNSVSGSLQYINNYIRNTRVSWIIKAGTDELIESRNGNNEHHHERKETSNFSKTSSQENHQVTNWFVHSQKGDQLHDSREEDQNVNNQEWSIDSAIFFC